MGRNAAMLRRTSAGRLAKVMNSLSSVGECLIVTSALGAWIATFPSSGVEGVRFLNAPRILILTASTEMCPMKLTFLNPLLSFLAWDFDISVQEMVLPLDIDETLPSL